MPQKTKPGVVVTGRIAADVIDRDDDADPWVALGGTAGNVATLLVGLGWDGELVARHDPADPATGIILDDARYRGVGTRLLHLPRVGPPPVFHQRRRAKKPEEPRFDGRCHVCQNHMKGNNQSTIIRDHVPLLEEPVKQARVLFFDIVSPAALELAALARKAGVLVVFEPGKWPEPRPDARVKPPANEKAARDREDRLRNERRKFREALELADVVKYSRSRLPELAESPLYPRRPRLEIETCGEEGLRYRLDDGSAEPIWKALPAVSIATPVDTAGCGDWCTAGFLQATARDGRAGFERLEREKIERALRIGQTLAAWNAGFEGARGGQDGCATELRTFLSTHVDETLEEGAFTPGPPPGPAPAAPGRTTFDLYRHLCSACRERSENLPAAGDDERWKPLQRVSYVDRKRDQARASLDHEYGEHGWRIVYHVNGKTISRNAALDLYTQSYIEFFRANPGRLDRLLSVARDVWDLDRADVESGLDYSIQNGKASHLQDIAIRLAVRHLGRTFEGDRLVRVRTGDPEGDDLSPGRIPFHRPEWIHLPEMESWWEKGSLESFWQSNKILQVYDPDDSVLILGGSFNPVHCGHLAVARDARDRLGFDRVLFVPVGDNYNKPGLAPAEHRVALIDAAIDGEAGFELLLSEVNSQKSFRGVRTAKELRTSLPGSHLVLYRGIDALKKFNKAYFDIPDLHFLFHDRPGAPESLEEIVATRPLLQESRHRIDHQTIDLPDVSSTAIREALAKGQPITAWVPPAVEALIDARGLYRHRDSA